MKNGKTPTRNQRKFIEEHHLNAENWLVVKDTSDSMELVHKYSDDVRKIISKT